MLVTHVLLDITPSYLQRELPTKTEAGRRWLIKALHPADGVIKAERVPASSRYPTVVQEVVSRFTISCPASVTTQDTWSFRLWQTTDPLAPIVVSFPNTPSSTAYDDPWGCGNLCYTWVNPVFFKSDEAYKIHSGDEYEEMLQQFTQSCETYRITALSTTGEFIGASLTDQGAVLGVQYPDRVKHYAMVDGQDAPADQFRVFSESMTEIGHVDVPNLRAFRALNSMAEVWMDPLPPKSQSTMAAHPYTQKAKEGWYMPQKLMAPGKWQATNDLCFRGRRVPMNPGTLNNANLMTRQVIRWPLGESMYEASGPSYWVKNCDDGLAVVYVDGLAKSSTFEVVVRLNLELGVSPMNEYAPFAESTPPPDTVAIDLYNEIVKDMFDAYPSRDNANETLVSKIKRIAKKVLGVIEPIAGIAGAVGVPYASAISGIAGSLARGGVKDMSAKDVEDAIADRDTAMLEKAKARLIAKGAQPAFLDNLPAERVMELYRKDGGKGSLLASKQKARAQTKAAVKKVKS